MKRLLLLIVLLVSVSVCACAQMTDIPALNPAAMQAESEAQLLDLYCGPTQGFHRQPEQTLDTGKPYVFFGQYDCWAMVAQGDESSFGPVGWVEAGSLPILPDEPLLGFDDSFSAMIEDGTLITDNPLADDPYASWNVGLMEGNQVIVLARYENWLYIQAEIGDTPVRAFVPAACIY